MTFVYLVMYSLHADKFGHFQIRKIREAIPSISGLFERLIKALPALKQVQYEQ